jgi:hypothetical protein
VCGGESLISGFSFILGRKDLQKPSDRRLGEPRVGLDIAIKENITASVKTNMFLLFLSYQENSSPLSHGKVMLVQGYNHILTEANI